ncbi:MAG: hypothetical protein V8R80_05225, partial [Eubacterium sp.]
MTVDIYYREWDGKNDSHEYLNQAIQQYYKTRGKSCPGDLTFARNGKFGKPYMEELPDLIFLFPTAESGGFVRLRRKKSVWMCRNRIRAI